MAVTWPMTILGLKPMNCWWISFFEGQFETVTECWRYMAMMSVFIWGSSRNNSDGYAKLMKGHICDLAQETKHYWWICVFEGQLRLSLDIEIKRQWCLSSSKDHHAISQIVIRRLWFGRCRVTPVMILHRSWYIGDEFLLRGSTWDCHWTLRIYI